MLKLEVPNETSPRTGVSCSFTAPLQAQQSAPAQQQANSPANSATTTEQPPASGCKQPCLEDGTPVKLRISQTVSSEDAHVNDRVEFEVLEEIKFADVIVIPMGAIALGTVTEAQPKQSHGARRQIGDFHGFGSSG